MDNLIAFSELRLRPKLPLSPRIPLPAPLALFVEFTNKCNFSCKFCPESFADYKEQVGGEHWIDFAGFKKICGDIREMGGIKVLRYYNIGETLLHKDAIAMFRYAADMRIADRTELTTNAAALTPRRAAEIVNSGLDYVRVSIYGINPERHKSITGASISPTRIAGNVRMLREARERLNAMKPFIYVKILDPHDLSEEAAFREVYRDIADEVQIEYPHEWTGSDAGKLLDDVYAEKADAARNRNKVGAREVCPLPFYQPAVHADGTVSMCCVDWNKKTAVGNIFEQSLSEIWHGDKVRAFQTMHIERRSHENEACRNCTYFHDQPDNIDDLTDAGILLRKPASLELSTNRK